MECSYKFRLYPTQEQAEQIQKTFGCCRFVWNHYLYMRKKEYEDNGHAMSYYECSKDMTNLKKKLTWLREADSHALQSSIHNLDNAFKSFFRRVKSGKKPGHPRYKSKKNHHQSYTTSDRYIRISGDAIYLPKLGFVKCRISRGVKGRILSVTVTKNPSGKYFASLVCSGIVFEPLPDTGASIDICIGTNSISSNSCEVEYTAIDFREQARRKIVRLHRQLSRKPKDSNRREKTRIKLACLHERIANQKIDKLHKTSIALVMDYDIILIRRANIDHNADYAWGELCRQLKYKSEWYGKKVVFIG